MTDLVEGKMKDESIQKKIDACAVCEEGLTVQKVAFTLILHSAHFALLPAASGEPQVQKFSSHSFTSRETKEGKALLAGSSRHSESKNDRFGGRQECDQ